MRFKQAMRPAISRLGDRVGAGDQGYSFKYIEFQPATSSGTDMGPSAVGVTISLPADGSLLGGANCFGWRADNGDVEGGGAGTIGNAGTWTSANRLGIGFIAIPALGLCWIQWYKDGTKNLEFRLSEYLTSPVRPAASLRNTANTLSMTLVPTGMAHLPAGATELVGATWIKENSIVLSGGDLIATMGTVAPDTPVRTNDAGAITF